MSSVSVMQKKVEFQPVTIAMTLSTEEELRHFTTVIDKGIAQLHHKTTLQLATSENLLARLKEICHASKI